MERYSGKIDRGIDEQIEGCSACFKDEACGLNVYISNSQEPSEERDHKECFCWVKKEGRPG